MDIIIRDINTKYINEIDKRCEELRKKQTQNGAGMTI